MNLNLLWSSVVTFMNLYIIQIMLATPLFMLANMVGGAIIADSRDLFDEAILKASVYKYMSMLFMALLIYFGGVLAEPALNEIIQANLEIVTLLQLGLATLCGRYAFQAIEKFTVVVGIKTNTQKEE